MAEEAGEQQQPTNSRMMARAPRAPHEGKFTAGALRPSKVTAHTGDETSAVWPSCPSVVATDHGEPAPAAAPPSALLALPVPGSQLAPPGQSPATARRTPRAPVSSLKWRHRGQPSRTPAAINDRCSIVSPPRPSSPPIKVSSASTDKSILAPPP
jgi:hypothetical protein